jgi:hypothetical protein
MATRLKNILHFVVTPGGGSVSLPHGLIVQNGRAVIPDHIEASKSGFVITADATNVTVSGDGDVDVLVEYWHSIERVFGDVATLALTPHPFIADGGGGAGGVPTPPFSVGTIIIYARITGSDATGNGSLATPYLTLQRAVRDVPEILPPGVRYIVDVTGITEVLPADYTLPAWKTPRTIAVDVGSQWFLFATAVGIQAIPQLMAAISPADATIAGADILSAVPVAVSGLIRLTLNVARASWAANALKGKFVVGATGGGENAVIIESTNNSILLATNTALTTPILVMEPSAHISGSNTPGIVPSGGGAGSLRAFNTDSLSFSGLEVTNTGGLANPGLACVGVGEIAVQMCKLQSPNVDMATRAISRLVRDWIIGTPFLGGYCTVQAGLMDACTGGIFSIAPSLPSFRVQCFDACDPIEVLSSLPGYGAGIPTATPFMGFLNCIVRNTPGATGDGIRFHGSRGRFNKLDVYGCGRDGIAATLGSGVLELLSCGTTGAANTGIGVHVDDGMFVKVDAVTSAAGTPPPNGTAGQMKVGDGAARTWANFLSGADGRPVDNEYDITAAAATGATGTGSRLYQ